jgi:hypothetical protein
MGTAQYIHTLRYLKPIQIFGRIRFLLHTPSVRSAPAPTVRKQAEDWVLPPLKSPSLLSPSRFACVANGSKGLFKEYVEVHQAGVKAVLKDFKELSVYGDGRPYNKKLFSQDKGQKEMVRTFVGAVRVGGTAPIPFEEIYTGNPGHLQNPGIPAEASDGRCVKAGRRLCFFMDSMS